MIQFGEVELTGDDIWYRSEPDGEKIGLSLFIRDWGSGDREARGNATFLLLDAALGEYHVATKIGFIDFEPLPADPQAESLKPLCALAVEVDAQFPATRQ